MQSEFSAATLVLHVNESELTLTRNKSSDQIRAQWEKNGQPFDVIIPARTGHVEVIPDTGIEVLSDLFFVLADVTPPKVRRSRLKEESELERLSMRDVLWYCYLDQDSMDSSFFNLDGEQFKKLKSRNVLRFIIGFHQEHVAELEAELQKLREDRLRSEGAVKAIREALESSDLSSPVELEARRKRLQEKLQAVESKIENARSEVSEHITHEMENLRERGRQLGAELGDCELALTELAESIGNDGSHRNTLLSLAARFKRAQSAREVLSGVEFNECPCCSRTLPEREGEVCRLCGQSEAETAEAAIDEAIDRDVANRVGELEQRIRLQEEQRSELRRKKEKLVADKSIVDAELNRASQAYDSAYLAAALESEKQRAAIVQESSDLKELEVIVKRIEELTKEIESLSGREKTMRDELTAARKQAEGDTANITELKRLFLDCLLRSRLVGFNNDDIVEARSPNFLPEVQSQSTGDLAVTSFANMGSGGKKCIFKCCFAVAIHRLAVQINAMLPKILIIDSPMKNISERENREQYEGFHDMLYELAQGELSGTQIIMIDKEIRSPDSSADIDFVARHMTPSDDKNPPLISYYRGK